jgi:hypothetical protein
VAALLRGLKSLAPRIGALSTAVRV